MRAVAWSIAAALVSGGCGAKPVDLSSLRTPLAPSAPAASAPPPAPSPSPTTFSLRLYVATMSVPCSGCLVEIINGPGKGTSGTTVDGLLTLPIPESGTVTVRASRDKYKPATTNLVVDGPNSRGQVILEAAVPTVDFSGPRLVEVRAGTEASCSRLPAELRVRTYAVSFAKSAPGMFTAEPTGGSFTAFAVYIFGLVDEAHVLIENIESGPPGIIERLPDGSTLRMGVWTDLFPIANRDAISASMSGTISYCEASGRCTVFCDSNAHQLTLTRR